MLIKGICMLGGDTSADNEYVTAEEKLIFISLKHMGEKSVKTTLYHEIHTGKKFLLIMRDSHLYQAHTCHLQISHKSPV